jgi:hypothetical protein
LFPVDLDITTSLQEKVAFLGKMMKMQIAVAIGPDFSS